ncbi:haloacid dehalogenase, type II [Rhodopirellula bahusiensis]|uniref:Haloacid dehalogenase, type II n=2 Tax=Rhodopirellula bahusiensis TaxID=2014065 RepID=A0A2G1W1M6_9BACT|nr:haloacid dehalogenase type II [Rhodopirellula bahusiensis]PHQ32885.1 haloacid dehalogenase, type II [Rhodopirellula bahusiensis]
MSFRVAIFVVPVLVSLSVVTTSSAQESKSVSANENAKTLAGQPSRKPIMSSPKVIVFDVNETLLDLAGLKQSVGEALNGREDLLPLWFSNMLHYSLVETLAGEYHDFGDIGTAALMMVAEQEGIELTQDDAKAAIVTPLRSLPAHADVREGLQRLSEQGFRLVSLTNSSKIGVETQMKNAGLTDLFEKRYSIDQIKKYKPHPDTYQMVLDDLGLQPGEVLMVAAHAWDLAGAKSVGMQTAFVSRPGKTLYPNVQRPDVIVTDLNQLADVMAEAKH